MAENEEEYLRQCLERNICPVCQQSITKKYGSGQFKDGVFCALGLEQSFADSTPSRQFTKE